VVVMLIPFVLIVFRWDELAVYSNLSFINLAEWPSC